MSTSFGKSLSLCRWLQIYQNWSTMHVFEGKNWISIFWIPFFSVKPKRWSMSGLIWLNFCFCFGLKSFGPICLPLIYPSQFLSSQHQRETSSDVDTRIQFLSLFCQCNLISSLSFPLKTTTQDTESMISMWKSRIYILMLCFPKNLWVCCSKSRNCSNDSVFVKFWRLHAEYDSLK